ncbi:MAG: heparin lyase I family protein [Hyphomicrobiales bacterium]|nr:heparin lyase I family protein [Hyphomicrobiales bacterium]MDE2017449.1 heparin lyase I family protein [Hyphomicrobiales bacterium]
MSAPSRIAQRLLCALGLAVCAACGSGAVNSGVGAPGAGPTPTPTNGPCGAVVTPAQNSTFAIDGTSYTTSYANTSWSFQTLCGGAVQRFELRPGDVGWSGDLGLDKQRSEIITADGYNSPYPYGHEIWLSYAFRALSSAPIVGWHVVGQWHDHPNLGSVALSPPLAFNLAPPPAGAPSGVVQLSLWSRSSPDPVLTVNPTATARWAANITIGQWNEIVLRVLPGFRNDAQLQLWVNGRQVLDGTALNVGYNEALGFGYWQFGVYRQEDRATEPASNIDVVEYANVEQGQNSLMARVGAPLPIPLK